jgi:hypothetical protein
LVLHDKWGKQEPGGQQANLCEANLQGADLQGARLREANLQGADLAGANLQRARLWKANLQGAGLWKANLQGAGLWKANLQGAVLVGANLQGAGLWEANLQGARLREANLQEANLREANLQEADLAGANLQGAKLREANLQEARLTNVTLLGTQYEPSSTPNKGFLGGMQGLFTVWFQPGRQAGLVLLRGTLKEVGLRSLEREATYALKRTERCYNWPVLCHPRFQRPGLKAPVGLFATLDGLFQFLFFEFTCAYGLKPGRALLILLGFMPVFACCYGLALRKAKRRAGIWVAYSPDRTYTRRDAHREWHTRVTQGIWLPSSTGRQNKRPGAKREWRALVTHRRQEESRAARTEAGRATMSEPRVAFRLPLFLSRLHILPRDQAGHLSSLCRVAAWWRTVRRTWLRPWLRTCRIALYFSMLSAFHLGWRELNVGSWITRMQGRNYTLSATGWVRSVSGLQSLLSVYLLALWALTYFGRPFE